jgi:hypothetical protein
LKNSMHFESAYSRASFEVAAKIISSANPTSIRSPFTVLSL